LNDLHHEQFPALAQNDEPAAFVPMDGYHLSRAQLDAMPDPNTAHARRGAAFTFDAGSFLEGNYLSLGTGAPEWKEAAELMDELWFVEVEEDVARERLVKRHIEAGIAQNEEEARKRADENDLVNGREIVQHRLSVHEVIKSKYDGSWKPENQGMDAADVSREA
jgi:pantothenate kinase